MENIILSKDLFTEDELAAYWGVKRKTLQKWRSLGIGPIYIKIGARAVYPKEAVQEYEQARIFAGCGKRIQIKGAEDDK